MGQNLALTAPSPFFHIRYQTIILKKNSQVIAHQTNSTQTITPNTLLLDVFVINTWL